LVGLAEVNYRHAVAATEPATIFQGIEIFRRLRIQWAGSGEDEFISRVSVFDTRCAAVYLTEKTDVAFRPFGLDGQKKLQDFLVDRKVARVERDRVPLVVDQNDRILWVAGYEIDEAFRVTEASRGVLILTLRHL